MKKTLFILSVLVASSLSVEASTVLVSFGINAGAEATSVVDGTYMGQAGQKVNAVKTHNGGSSYTSSALVDSSGATTGITVVTGGTCCGGGGVLGPGNVQLNQSGGSFYDVFGQDMVLGNPMGGVVNASSGTSFTMNMRGLSVGTYTLTILAGRGNTFDGASAASSFSIGGDNISNISASLADSSVGSDASVNGSTITGNTYSGDWMLMTYTFDVTADNTSLNINSNGGKGNINSLALTMVPEPATAGLGLLGLGFLLMRRRVA